MEIVDPRHLRNLYEIEKLFLIAIKDDLIEWKMISHYVLIYHNKKA